MYYIDLLIVIHNPLSIALTLLSRTNPRPASFTEGSFQFFTQGYKREPTCYSQRYYVQGTPIGLKLVLPSLCLPPGASGVAVTDSSSNICFRSKSHLNILLQY